MTQYRKTGFDYYQFLCFKMSNFHHKMAVLHNRLASIWRFREKSSDFVSNDLPTEIKRLAKIYKVEVYRDTENCDRNTAACAGNQIFMGMFDDTEIELAAFFHELGHIVMSETVLRGRLYTMSTMSTEGTAWEVGFGIAYQHGYVWDYNDKVMDWARYQLGTYWESEYNDLPQGREPK